ncbi:MAG: hypothetical protein SQA66_11960, partial [Candidatus Fervidibacter sacchari]
QLPPLLFQFSDAPSQIFQFPFQFVSAHCLIPPTKEKFPDEVSVQGENLSLLCRTAADLIRAEKSCAADKLANYRDGE